MLALFRNPLLRLLGRLWWLPLVLAVLVAGSLGGAHVFERAILMLAVFLAAVAGMVGSAWAHGTIAVWCERLRHRQSGHRFLCPHCLLFGPVRIACARCEHTVEEFAVATRGVYVNDCPSCHEPLFVEGSAEQRNVVAQCSSCKAVAPREIHHERSVRVLGVLASADLDALQGWGGGTVADAGGYRCLCRDGGACLTYILDLGSLPNVRYAVVQGHALREVSAVWVRHGAADALALGQAADRFARQVGMAESGRLPLPVCVGGAALDPAARNLLEARFATVRYGVGGAAFLGRAGPIEARARMEVASIVAPATDREPPPGGEGRAPGCSPASGGRR